MCKGMVYGIGCSDIKGEVGEKKGGGGFRGWGILHRLHVIGSRTDRLLVIVLK